MIPSCESVSDLPFSAGASTGLSDYFSNYVQSVLVFPDVGCVDNVGLEGGGTLVGRTPHGGVVSKVIMLLLHTTTLVIPQAKSSYKTTLPPLTLFTLLTLFQQSRLCIYKLSGKVRTLLEWADELLSKNLNGWVMGDTPYGLHCYDYASNDTI